MQPYSLYSLHEVELNYGEGLRALLRGDFSNAVGIFDKLMTGFLNNPLSWHYISSIFDSTGKSTEAGILRHKTRVLCRSILERAGSNALVASLRKGITCLSRRKPWAAMLYFGTHFLKDPGDTAAWVYVGLLLEDFNLVPEAQFCFLQGLSHGVLECGILFDQLARVGCSPKNFLGLTTDNYKASISARFYDTTKGKVFIDLVKDRQHEIIARHHEEYLAWNSQSYLLQSGILAALFALGQNDKALHLARDFVQHDPANPDKHSALGIACLGIKSVDEGLRAINAAIELDPTRAQDWHQLAALYVSLGDYSRAEHAITMAIFWQPLNVQYWELLVDIYSRIDLGELSSLAGLKAASLATIGLIIPGYSTGMGNTGLLQAIPDTTINGAFEVTRNANRILGIGAAVPDSAVWLRFLMGIGRPQIQYDPKLPAVFRSLLAGLKGLPPSRHFEPFTHYVLLHLAMAEKPGITRGALARILGIGLNRVGKMARDLGKG